MIVLGEGHLADALAAEIEPHKHVADKLAFIAEDITDHDDKVKLSRIVTLCEDATDVGYRVIVIVSQVPPGWTRGLHAIVAAHVFYQADTIIVRNAVSRLRRPEQFIIGCEDPAVPLPISYQQYLVLHDAPVLQMSYESAELAKCAINYTLAKQIDLANELDAIASSVGADYADVEKALRGDRRIGPHAYLRPGRANQHLLRDVRTLERLKK